MKAHLIAVIMLAMSASTNAADPLQLDSARASEFAKVALGGIAREYPNKPGEVLTGPQDLKSPRTMHPAFYGSYDWHSSVHGHWLLVRLLKLFPNLVEGAEARSRLREPLTTAGTGLAPKELQVKE